MYVFGLAERLGGTVSQLKEGMSQMEYQLWIIYDEVRAKKEEEAMKKARKKS